MLSCASWQHEYINDSESEPMVAWFWDDKEKYIGTFSKKVSQDEYLTELSQHKF